MQGDPTEPLDYAPPGDDTPNVDGLLDTAKATALAGTFVPLLAAASIAWSIFALCQENIASNDRTRALQLIGGASIIFLINIGVSFLLLMWLRLV